MDSTVEKDAVVIVNTKLVTQYLVNVTTAVDLDGRVANVIKVLNFACNILMLHIRYKIQNKNKSEV